MEVPTAGTAVGIVDSVDADIQEYAVKLFLLVGYLSASVNLLLLVSFSSYNSFPV